MKLYKRIILKLMSIGFFNWLPTKPYIKWKFKLLLGYKLNLDDPKTFNEKLNWLKINEKNQEYTKYVDKYLVRKHIAKTIGEEYLVPLIGVYNSTKEIPWKDLPNKFVLKCTTGSGGNVICTDKEKCDINKSEKKLNSFLKKNYFYLNRETPYKQVKPRIICEEFISENSDTPDDYKFMCFNGVPKLIQIHRDRFNKTHSLDFYNTDWKKTTISQGNLISNIEHKKPENYDNLYKLTCRLADKFIHIRIDWYIVNNKIYFGEMTFCDGGGFDKFDSYDDDLLLGSWLELPIDK